MKADKTAVVLIEFQNEFCNKGVARLTVTRSAPPPLRSGTKRAIFLGLTASLREDAATAAWRTSCSTCWGPGVTSVLIGADSFKLLSNLEFQPDAPSLT